MFWGDATSGRKPCGSLGARWIKPRKGRKGVWAGEGSWGQSGGWWRGTGASGLHPGWGWGGSRSGDQNAPILGRSVGPGHGSHGAGRRAKILVGWCMGSRAWTPGRGSGCKHLGRVFPVLPDQRGPPGTFLVLPLSRPGDRDPDGSESGRSGCLPTVLNLSITQKSSFYQPVFTDKETRLRQVG